MAASPMHGHEDFRAAADMQHSQHWRPQVVTGNGDAQAQGNSTPPTRTDKRTKPVLTGPLSLQPVRNPILRGIKPSKELRHAKLANGQN